MTLICLSILIAGIIVYDCYKTKATSMFDTGLSPFQRFLISELQKGHSIARDDVLITNPDRIKKVEVYITPQNVLDYIEHESNGMKAIYGNPPLIPHMEVK